MHRPTSAASRTVRDRSALIKHHKNAGSAAAAARLKCPVVRATIAGAHANTRPPRNASGREADVELRASPYANNPFSTLTNRNTTLNEVTMPSHEISGSANRFRNGV